MKTTFKAIVALFFCYHLAAVSIVLLPTESQLKKSLRPCFSWYLTASGNKQYWSMFTGIPYNHRHNVDLEIVDKRGKRIERSVLLPDLAPYIEGYFRYHSLFVRMNKPAYRRYLKAYADTMKARLEARDGVHIKSLTIRLNFERIQSLKSIRRTGRISKSKVVTMGPFRWP